MSNRDAEQVVPRQRLATLLLLLVLPGVAVADDRASRSQRDSVGITNANQHGAAKAFSDLRWPESGLEVLTRNVHLRGSSLRRVPSWAVRYRLSRSPLVFLGDIHSLPFLRVEFAEILQRMGDWTDGRPTSVLLEYGVGTQATFDRIAENEGALEAVDRLARRGRFPDEEKEFLHAARHVKNVRLVAVAPNVGAPGDALGWKTARWTLMARPRWHRERDRIWWGNAVLALAAGSSFGHASTSASPPAREGPPVCPHVRTYRSKAPFLHAMCPNARTIM